MANFDDFIEHLAMRRGLETFGAFYGVYRAKVVRNDDPDERGRIQIRCARVGHTQGLEVWVDSAGDAMGNDMGGFFPPEVDSTVWVVFDNGDPSRPLCFWKGWVPKDKLPLEFSYNVETGLPEKRGIVTRMGHMILLNDEEDNESIRIIWHKSEVDDPARSDLTIAADRTEGDFSLLSFEPDGSVQIVNKNGSRIDLEATEEAVMITSEQGNMVSMDSDGIKILDKSGQLIALVNGSDIQLIAKDTVHVVAPKVSLKAASVFLGSEAAQSLIQGELFKLYNDTHTHTTGVGPSGPPIVPLPDAVLSKGVKTRG